jgi:hypothetical protein
MPSPRATRGKWLPEVPERGLQDGAGPPPRAAGRRPAVEVGASYHEITGKYFHSNKYKPIMHELIQLGTDSIAKK